MLVLAGLVIEAMGCLSVFWVAFFSALLRLRFCYSLVGFALVLVSFLFLDFLHEIGSWVFINLVLISITFISLLGKCFL